MDIYLPIAEMSVNIYALLLLGVVTGILSGMFGVGGGFLITPLLMFIGVPPPVAVASSANQIIASSVSGFVAHWNRQNVDFRIGLLLLAGGMVGSTLGVWLFKWLLSLGQIDLIISLVYVVFLGSIGALMIAESSRTIWRQKKKLPAPAAKAQHPWVERLPFRMHFPRSNLPISMLLPIFIGMIAGVMVSLMGIGGGFFLIPAMIYLLRMPTSIVIGTSLFQIIFITANVTFLQAVNTQTVDIVLALILLTGSVFGAQLGTKLGGKLPAEYLRGLLALIVLCVTVKLAYGLIAKPDELYSVETVKEAE